MRKMAKIVTVAGVMAAAGLGMGGVAYAQGGSGISWADQQQILALHNQYRAEVGTAPLQWDDRLAADAQVWVNELAARGGSLDHGTDSDPNSSAAKNEGENLALGAPAAEAPSMWYGEKSAFDQAVNKTAFNDSNPDWVNWGHYTQMVWSDTTRVGCASANGPEGEITSCRYSPPGNMDGELAYPGADRG